MYIKEKGTQRKQADLTHEHIPLDASGVSKFVEMSEHYYGKGNGNEHDSRILIPRTR